MVKPVMLFEAKENDLLERLEHSCCLDLVLNRETLNDEKSFVIKI
jgi:hypothetical protein